ncbi:MAG: ATP-binding cassette domain-containing protein [Calditrichaeota bacterium]|nr:ATP-binding cassette domain-containing protein [Calditrichota bacterium]
MATEPLAKIENLIAKFGDRVVLDGVNLSIFPREILTIIGGSGSGKTTLLKHLMGLERPHRGCVEVFGRDWWGMEEEEKENKKSKS